MDALAFRQLVDEVRERTDLAALIGESIPLRPSGSVLRGRSPVHRDTTPSLVVWPHTRTWRDFAGGGAAGGDCFDFLQYQRGLGFVEALHLLAARAGIEIPGRGDPALAAEARRLAERRRIEELLTAAAAYYHRVLPPAVRRAWYGERYGFTDETIDTLQLGWSDGRLFDHMTGALGALPQDALATGLFVRLRGGRIKDFFCHRLVFPYWKHGRVVYFIARATDRAAKAPWEDAKYKKLLTRSPRHPYVSRAIANDTFYGEDAARGARELLITEGTTDCISAMQAGVACISPGTVRFRKRDQEKLLALTARTERVILCNDAEASGAGEAGALETARVLHAAGRDVRIAVLPRPPGQDKLDLNELVATQGPEALRRVLAAARRLPEHLIMRTPADTSKAELDAQLAPVLDLIRASAPALREAYADLLRERFQLTTATIEALLGAPGPPAGPPGAAGQGQEQGQNQPAITRRGEVFEGRGHYYTLGRDGEPVILSSFCIEPTQRIVVEEGEGEIIDATVRTERGHTYRDVRFPREAWSTRYAFLRVLRPVDLQWTGSDEHVQGVLRLVAAREVPVRRGTRNLGYLDTAHGPRWVTPDGVLAPAGQAADDGLVYVPSGASLARRVRFQPPREPAVEAAAAAVILPALLQLNAPAVILPVLGWFFAAPLRPRIARRLGHFPILTLWGTQGSGKSSLIMEVFWPLFGAASSEPYSATETEFALLKTLSATDSVPVFIDEYKPFDMPRHRRNALHRYMRRLYTGEVEERGRADQSVNTYRLSAPLCLAGETRPIEPALVERILAANPDKDALLQNPEHARALARIKSVDPGLLTASIIRFLLGRDTDADLGAAREMTTRILGGRALPFRVRDNLTVMMLGLCCFVAYAQRFGIALPELSISGAVDAMLEDLLEGGTGAVKTGLDYFLEELLVMAVAGSIQHGRHYVYHEGLLALHFPSCHAAYAEHCRRTGFEGEVPDRKALRRQILESHRRGKGGGYVREVDARVCFAGRSDRRRAVLVDLEAARRALAVDDFPRPESEAAYCGWPTEREQRDDT